MSRRKQTKPQHLKSDEEALQTDSLSKKAVLLNGLDEDENSREARSEESHVCERCCAEFFTWTELCEHQTVCTVDPLVLIVKDGEDMSPAGLSPSPSMDTCDSADMDYTDGGNELAETLNHHSNQDFQEASKEDKPMVLEQLQEKRATTSLESTNSSSPQMTSVTSYGMPTTNVTLEILHSTSVAVAQFSQGISSSKNGGKAATASIPVLLEHLVVLHQQQVQQLQLIEQIRSQVAIMNRQPTLTALNPASRALALAPNHLPSQGPVTTPVLPLSGTMPSVINGQASVTMSSDMSSGSHSGQSNSREVTCTLPSSHASSSTTSSSISTPLPLYTGSHTSVGSGQTTSSSSVLSLGQSSLLSTSSSLPFLTQSPPGSVIFPNPLASIAATANALDPLAALMKNRKGKLPNVSIFDTKPSPEEPFFKHKCRFCAKVFGSDSALQIHLRSHTGERPFKCNICGNRFSTKGNLKVHFQRHKEKYPHVQMNPYPVPEYLDNVPTSSGIPYGMSFPPEKPGSSWLESKPVLATPPSSAAHQLPTTLSSLGSSNDSGSVTPSMKSPYRPASSECASLSPDRTNSEPHVPPYCFESPQCNRLGETSYAFKSEGVPLPQNCTTRPRLSPPVTTATNTTATPTVSTQEPSPPASPPPNPSLSLASDQSKANFPFGGLLVDSMQTSETSKLQQLVENIDKKITDPNQCVLCHRVLSCQSSLKMHYRIHTGERPFKCKVCGRAFSTKGNLKTHFSVHRSNPPLHVLHSCPICQKKFTNAVVLQQHIRMHMGGQISNSPHMEGLQERDADLSYVENFDSLSGHDNDFSDDVSMDEEDEGAEEETSNLEGIEDPVRNFSSVCCSPPKSSEVVSSIAALENQMRMIDSTVSLNHAFGINSLLNGFIDRDRFTISSSSTERKEEDPNSDSPTMSESSSCTNIPASPLQSSGEGHTHMSPADTHRSEAQVVAAKVKNEQTESPTSAMGHGMSQELRESQLSKHWIKKEAPYSLLFQQSRECVSQSISSLVHSTPSNMIKTEMNGHSRTNPANEGHWQQQTLFGFHLPATYSSMESPVMTSLIGPAPPRRTPKQHNCSACGKNFSSASALQIHERTHTGEKPFGCSICGRAFTTKGNLKVHMGTHMWNNAPARRGRRLSLENPMALLGGDAMKFGQMFQKGLAARAMNVDPGFWNRYAAAITNGLAMKNNEISVIQNGGIPHLHALTAGMDRVSMGNSQTITSLGKSGMELGINRHFSMLIDDSKEIGIN